MSFIEIMFNLFSISYMEITKIFTFFYFARYWNGAAPINARSNSLALIDGTGLRIIAGWRIRLADTMYFFPSLSASLLTPRYASRTPEMASKILIGFNFFDFWGSAGAVALVVGFSTCSAENIVALVLRCNSTGVLTVLGRDPECWQCPGQKASLSQLMSRITPCFCIHGLPKINGCWSSFVIRNGANNLVWSCTVNVG